jgi:deoxyribose-phosphate aldolase
MDQEQIIDKIVSEVMTRLKAADAAPSGGGAPAPKAKPALSPMELAKFIDHTLLKPEAATGAFDKLVDEAIRYGFFSVCVNSSRVAYVAKKLQGTPVKVCSVVGFPLGAMTSRSKAFETREAVADGAREIDMVINVGLLKSGDFAAVEEDIRAVRRATRPNILLKVIIETTFLSQDEKVMACRLAQKAGADFVKTSTGFSGGGATVEDIALMRQIVGKSMGVKASGGVRTYKSALALIEAGASRIGAAGSVAIVTDQESTGSY